MNTQFKIFCDDSINILKTLPDNSIDSLITDPPSGIGFLKLDWDKDKGGRDQWVLWMTEIMTECHRVLKPGAHGFVWALPRTSHWTASALESSGFNIKDIVTHVFGSGFPKSQSIEKMIRKSKRIDLTRTFVVTEWIRKKKIEKKMRNQDLDREIGVSGGAAHWTAKRGNQQAQMPTLKNWDKIKKLLGTPPTEIEKTVRDYHQNVRNPEVANKLLKASQKWTGWGTALKPASEHWILIQKPIAKRNTAANVLKYRTGALNIDASRVPNTDSSPRAKKLEPSSSPFFGAHTNHVNQAKNYVPHEEGRFPANLVLSKCRDLEYCPARKMDKLNEKPVSHFFKQFNPDFKPFHYSPKPTTKEKGEFNNHPTVKPLSLMRYLIKMITPPKGIVLDPFMGSGTTGVASLFENFYFIGVEKEESYFSISRKRICGVQNLKNKK